MFFNALSFSDILNPMPPEWGADGGPEALT
jgi:hypothetical protein